MFHPPITHHPVYKLRNELIMLGDMKTCNIQVQHEEPHGSLDLEGGVTPGGWSNRYNLSLSCVYPVWYTSWFCCNTSWVEIGSLKTPNMMWLGAVATKDGRQQSSGSDGNFSLKSQSVTIAMKISHSQTNETHRTATNTLMKMAKHISLELMCFHASIIKNVSR